MLSEDVLSTILFLYYVQSIFWGIFFYKCVSWRKFLLFFQTYSIRNICKGFYELCLKIFIITRLLCRYTKLNISAHKLAKHLDLYTNFTDTARISSFFYMCFSRGLFLTYDRTICYILNVLFLGLLWVSTWRFMTT